MNNLIQWRKSEAGFAKPISDLFVCSDILVFVEQDIQFMSYSLKSKMKNTTLTDE